MMAITGIHEIATKYDGHCHVDLSLAAMVFVKDSSDKVEFEIEFNGNIDSYAGICSKEEADKLIKAWELFKTGMLSEGK